MKYLIGFLILSLLLIGCVRSNDYTETVCEILEDELTEDGYCLVQNDGDITYNLMCFEEDVYVKLRINTDLERDLVLTAIQIGWETCYITE